MLVGEFGLLVEQLGSAGELPVGDPLVPNLARVLVTAIAERDAGTVRVFVDILSQHDLSQQDSPSPELRAILHTLECVARAALEPLEPPHPALEAGSLAARILNALLAEPELTNTDLCERLGTDATQLSRTGRKLVEAGLAVRHKRGRTNRWVVTPKGRMAVAAAALGSSGGHDHVVTVFAELLRATSEEEITAAAETLVRLGLAERRSANTRGSLVRAAPPRLPAETEQGLIELYEADGPTRNHILPVLAEWGSAYASRAISARALGGTAVDVESLRALRRVGGADASITLSRLLESELEARAPRTEIIAETINALTELASGGRLDMTDRSPPPGQDERWHSDNEGAAGRVVGVVHRALMQAARHSGLNAYLQQRSELTAHEVVEWAAQNGIRAEALSRLPSEDASDSAGADALSAGDLVAFFGDLDAYLEEASRSGALVGAVYPTEAVEPHQAESTSKLYELPGDFRRRLGFGSVLIARLEPGRLQLTLDDVRSGAADEVIAYVETPDGRLGSLELVPAEGDATMLTGAMPWRAALPARIGLRLR